MVEVVPATLHRLPQHDVVVTPKLEQVFVFGDVVPEGEYAFEVPDPVQLLRTLQQHQPVLRRQQL